MYAEATPSDLREAIKDYIWHRKRSRYQFSARRDVKNIAQSTGSTEEEVERAFFGLAGDVWVGEITHRGHGTPNSLALGPMTPPDRWANVSFDVAWMQWRGTLPTREHP